MYEYEITADGTTVWVNTTEGVCIGRFGRRGIDVHRAPGDQTLGECLFCTHVETTLEDWKKFVWAMQRHHGVLVSDSFVPDRFL